MDSTGVSDYLNLQAGTSFQDLSKFPRVDVLVIRDLGFGSWAREGRDKCSLGMREVNSFLACSLAGRDLT